MIQNTEFQQNITKYKITGNDHYAISPQTASRKTSSAVVTEIINCTQSVLSLHDSEISAKEIKNTKFILPTESIQK